MLESSGRRWVRVSGAVGLTAGLAAGGYGVAAAASGGSAGAGSGTAPRTAPAPGYGYGRFGPAPGGPDGPGALGGGPRRFGFGKGPGGAVGTITALGTGSFTVTGPAGRVTTVDTTSTTTYQRDGVAATASDLAVGERVAVRGTPPAAGTAGTAATTTVTATAVEIIDPYLAGKVKSVSGSVLTVVDGQGFWRTVNLSGSTTYSKSGTAATVSDVTAGETVIAFGAIDSDHTSLDATRVDIPPTGAGGGWRSFGPLGFGPGAGFGGPGGPGGAPSGAQASL